ncbi:hypothetical protein AGOR_G00088200 [Albula goreensis]|uniref:FHA domain-containing protein n=1 Tax=Albula goreensis TaxID=1534307 RepID=A0A8T3DUH9_9TELE|nr:hypothetical protein AGOR_G00088200 [Albula goreensis]
MSVTSWFLVSSSATRHRLPREMIFVGREDCELMLQSRSVDKQHAVINYDPVTDEHLVKDLGSLNGTFVNDLRIPDQTYVTLKLSDVIRFGYDILIFAHARRSQHHVPEEALKHEKYTSHLQMSLKSSEGKRPDPPDGASDSLRSRQDKSDRRAATSETPGSRPTPLYGQPSWWGEDDPGNKGRHGEGRRPDEGHPESPKECSGLEPEVSGSLSDYRVSQGKSIYSYGREPSYFEIPTKEFQARPKSPDTEVQEIPTKDTDTPAPQLPSPSPALVSPTPPVVQSHASFTIEFDDCRPGKIKIKDHVTKFSSRQHKPPGGRHQATTPTEVMSAESKVADWLVHSDISMMRRRAPCEDVCSTKSDLAMNIKTLKGHHHDDGTQSDSEDPILKGKRSKSQQPIRAKVEQRPDSPPQPQPQPQPAPPHKPAQPRALSPRQPTPPTPPALEEAPCRSPPGSASPPQSLGKPPHAPELHSQQAFIIEFFDDNPRKRRSQSFTHTSAHAHADTYSALKAKLERRKGPAPSGQIPPTQQVTVPLKGQGHSGPQRASSLHREKADERGASSSAGIAIKPFGSLGKNSKLAQEFAAELLKEAGQTPASARDKTPSPPNGGQHTRAGCLPHPHLRPYPPTTTTTTTTVPLPPPSLTPLVVARSVDPKTSKAVRGEEEDSLSDAGTYTIETETQDREVEEARKMIDQVFGVLDSPEYTGVSPGTHRPVIKEERGEWGSPRHVKISPPDPRAAPSQGHTVLSGAPTGPVQVELPSSAAMGGPRWVSQWASLADSYSDSGPPTGLSDGPSQTEPIFGGGEMADQVTLGSDADGPESEGSQTSSRARRLLPQVPLSDKTEGSAPSPLLILPDLGLGPQAAERGPIAALHQLDLADQPLIQEELEPDSLSDTSRSDDGSMARRSRRSQEGGAESEGRGQQEGVEEGVGPGVRSTSFYIGHVASHEPRKPVKPNASAPNLQAQDRDLPSAKEPSIIRQESFTKDRPSNDIQLNRLPHISSHPALIDLDPWGPDADTIPPLLRSSGRGSRQGQGEDSLSGESDVDTASTVSLVSSKNAPASTAPARKRSPAVSSLQKEKSSSSPSVRDQARQPTARERLSEKRRTQADATAAKADPVKRFQLRRSTGNRGSLDLSDQQQQSWSGAASSSSDHESSSRAGARRKPTVMPLQKDDGGKSSKNAVQQALIRSNSLSAPRPTRASLLRRARLGEGSDGEGGETDRASQGSDVGTPSKPPCADGKKLSRLDVLAMPRKRSGSFTAPGDAEAAAGRGAGTARKPQVAEPKPGATGRQPIIRPAPAVPSARRRTDYTSTSEEEYEASSASTKHKRPHASAATQAAGSQRPAPAPTSGPAPRKAAPGPAEEEEVEPDNEADPYQHWSTHSAEIARLSQDLAKDLAILAREIHDVAGDGDSPSSSAAAASPSSAANTPASTFSAREEVILDNLMLNPVSQLSQAIRENTEQLAEKMKSLFHNKTEIWEEIEAKINAENEVPILKTSNKEISSILKELRRVQKQLEVINTIIEPGAHPELAGRAVGKTRPSAKDSRAAPQTHGGRR